MDSVIRVGLSPPDQKRKRRFNLFGKRLEELSLSFNQLFFVGSPNRLLMILMMSPLFHLLQQCQKMREPRGSILSRQC